MWPQAYGAPAAPVCDTERPYSSLRYLAPVEFATRQPDLPLGATPLAPGRAPPSSEQRTLIAGGMYDGGGPLPHKAIRERRADTTGRVALHTSLP